MAEVHGPVTVIRVGLHPGGDELDLPQHHDERSHQRQSRGAVCMAVLRNSQTKVMSY